MKCARNEVVDGPNQALTLEEVVVASQKLVAGLDRVDLVWLSLGQSRKAILGAASRGR